MRLTWSTVSVLLLTWGSLWSRIALLPVEFVKVSYRQIQNLLKPTSSGHHFVSQKTNLDKKISHWSFFYKSRCSKVEIGHLAGQFFTYDKKTWALLLLAICRNILNVWTITFHIIFWPPTQGKVPGFSDMSQHSSCDTLWRILMIIVPFGNVRLKTGVVEVGGRWGKKMINMWLRQSKTCSVLVKWYNWYNW